MNYTNIKKNVIRYEIQKQNIGKGKFKSISLYTRNTGIGATKLWNGVHERFDENSNKYIVYRHNSKWCGNHTRFN